jgi:drug/metabolite transporter (DMT)-like permease
MDWLTLIIFVVMCAVWGAEYLLVAKALDYFPTASMMLLPQAFSIPILLVITYIVERRHPSPDFNHSSTPPSRGNDQINPINQFLDFIAKLASVDTLPRFAILQLAFIAFIFHGIGDMGFSYAEKWISSSVVAAIYCLEPVSASLFAYFRRLKHGVLDETEWFGLIMSVTGVLALVFPELTSSKSAQEHSSTEGGSGKTVWFMLFCILAAVISVTAYGIGTAISQNVLEYYAINESKATLVSNFFGAVFILLETLLFDLVSGERIGSSLAGLGSVPLTGWIYILTYTVSSSVICGMMYMWLLKRLGAKAALNTILVRLFALFFGVTLNGEWDGYSWWDAKIQIMGAFISLFGLLCMLRREFEEDDEDEEEVPTGVYSPRSGTEMSYHVPESSFRI